VPIIPDYLCTLDANTNTTASVEEDENGRVGLLLSSKALVQLILNPVVGTLTGTLGYARPLFLGNLSLLLAALRKLWTTLSPYLCAFPINSSLIIQVLSHDLREKIVS